MSHSSDDRLCCLLVDTSLCDTVHTRVSYEEATTNARATYTADASSVSAAARSRIP